MTIAGFRCIGWVDLPTSLGRTVCDRDPEATFLDLLGKKIPERSAARRRALLDLAIATEPRAVGLPVFALVHTVAAPSPVVSEEARIDAPRLRPEQALLLLSRSAGGVFLAGRRPRIAVAEWWGKVHRWFVPVAGAAR